METLNNFLENLKQNKLSDIDWSLLLNWKYLTEKNPSELFIYEQWLYVIVLLNIILSVVGFTALAKLFIQAKPKYRFVRKVSFLWFTNTVFLLLYNLLRSEGVGLLSMRLILLIIGIAYLAILIYIPVYWIAILPKRMKEYENAKLRDKYTARKKR